MDWAYDSFGNYKSETLSGNTQFPMPQPLPYSYTGTNTNRIDNWNYDAAGNQLSDPISGSNNYYVYDAEERLSSAGNGSVQYVYDAEGRRVGKLHGPALTNQYLLGLGGEQVSELDGQGNWIHSNAYAGGQLLATYDKFGLHFQFADWLGSRRKQASGQGVVEETCLNLPFGDMLQCSGAGYDATKHHFTGKERDAESGLDYFGARYYASSMGRWMSPDWSAKQEAVPYSILDNPQSLNLYSYGWNNPLSNRDEDGHEVDLTGTDKDKQTEQQRLAANASKTDKNGVKESSLFKSTTDKNGKTTLTLDKDAAGKYQGSHSEGYNLLTGAIDAKQTITVQMTNTDSQTMAPDANGNVTVNLNRNVSGIDLVSPLRGFDGNPIPNPFQIIAGHEVLGHAYQQDIMHRGTQGTSADREMWVRSHTENTLRKEQGLPLRDPHSN